MEVLLCFIILGRIIAAERVKQFYEYFRASNAAHHDFISD